MSEQENAALNPMQEQGAEGAAQISQGEETVAAESAEMPGAEINLDALMDVPVTLSVEIGRNKLSIKELLRLNQGAVVELDREVNEPLDLLVNGTLMARGEVVVVDGQFGLRLVDIVSPSERINGLK